MRIDVVRAAKSEAGSMLPLMLAVALFASVLALVSFEAADLSAFRQTLQFDADQFALVAATTHSQTVEAISSAAGIRLLRKPDVAEITFDGEQANVRLCSTWQGQLKVIFAPTNQSVCVTSSAR